MPRASTTSDAFNAIAEPQRRRILTLLRAGELPVNDVAAALRMAQPRASKHLRVLREVGLVRVREDGRRRVYGLDAGGLEPVRAWLGGFERFWSGSFDRLEGYVRELERKAELMAAVAGGRDTAEREIVVSRLIDAPRHRVFEAYTEVRHLSRWWGPDGFTTTTRSFEFRPGGVWEFVMHGPDGTDYPNRIEWQEIVPPDRIVLWHGSHEGDADAFLSTITLEEREGRTELTLRSVFNTKAQRDMVVERYGALEGGEQTLRRLAAHVAAG